MFSGQTRDPGTLMQFARVVESQVEGSSLGVGKECGLQVAKTIQHIVVAKQRFLYKCRSQELNKGGSFFPSLQTMTVGRDQSLPCT